MLNNTDFSAFNELLLADNTLGVSGTGYFDVLQQVSRDYSELAYLERLWAAWYLFMQNDTYATGILTFVLHESILWVVTLGTLDRKHSSEVDEIGSLESTVEKWISCSTEEPTVPQVQSP
ncbi:hypothetical protein CEP52_003784 [Fusarium oligoseptatum]|uniref:Uncharacterized protein n=1 Tax=Fusarium oligoseptatum TaxID=2604345 RepID=A0A428U704_9HYPO|nr:hypothetical protein CEP52_003784 [Fusarium oligoseptatum]